MSFDTWTVSAVANQLRETIVPGRVQQVVQVDDASLAFEIYAQRQRFYLLASASQQTPRLHLLSDKPRRESRRPRRCCNCCASSCATACWWASISRTGSVFWFFGLSMRS